MTGGMMSPGRGGAAAKSPPCVASDTWQAEGVIMRWELCAEGGAGGCDGSDAKLLPFFIRPFTRFAKLYELAEVIMHDPLQGGGAVCRG